MRADLQNRPKKPSKLSAQTFASLLPLNTKNRYGTQLKNAMTDENIEGVCDGYPLIEMVAMRMKDRGSVAV